MNETKATRYQRLRRRSHVAGIASGGLMLGGLALTPASRWLATRAIAIGAGLSGVPLIVVSVMAFAVGIVVLWEIAALPAVLYLATRVDRRYHGSESSVEDTLAAQAQATLVTLPVAIAAAIVWRGSVALAGSWWWCVAGAALAAGLVAAVRVGPGVLARLGETTPIGSADLASRVAALAQRVRIPLAGIREWRVGDRSGVTALVAGTGRARRVFIASTLVRDWTEDEIAVVVAHELAHHRYQDLWRTLGLNAVLLSASLALADGAVRALGSTLGLTGAGDLAAVPLLAIVAGAAWILATPIRHAQSRRQERRADVYALAITGGAEAFSAAVRRLGARHLAEERPSLLTRWLFHRHPSVADRIALAEAYRRVRPT